MSSTEFSLGPGGDIVYPLVWAYDASINFLDSEEVMRGHFENAGFRIRDWINYTDTVVEQAKQMSGTPSRKLGTPLVFGEDTPERMRNTQRNLIEKRIIYWMIIAQRL